MATKNRDPLDDLAQELSPGYFNCVEQEWRGQTLSTAARERCLDALERGALPSGRIEGSEGSASLLCCAAAMGDVALVRALVERGAELEDPVVLPRGRRGPTALGVAALAGFDDVGAELGRLGADPNAQARLRSIVASAGWVAIFLGRQKMLREVALRMDFRREFQGEVGNFGDRGTENLWVAAALYSPPSFQLFVELGLVPPANLVDRLRDRGYGVEVGDWLFEFFARGQADAMASASADSAPERPQKAARL